MKHVYPPCYSTRTRSIGQPEIVAQTSYSRTRVGLLESFLPAGTLSEVTLSNNSLPPKIIVADIVRDLVHLKRTLFLDINKLERYNGTEVFGKYCFY